MIAKDQKPKLCITYPFEKMEVHYKLRVIFCLIFQVFLISGFKKNACVSEVKLFKRLSTYHQKGKIHVNSTGFSYVQINQIRTKNLNNPRMSNLSAKDLCGSSIQPKPSRSKKSVEEQAGGGIHASQAGCKLWVICCLIIHIFLLSGFKKNARVSENKFFKRFSTYHQKGKIHFNSLPLTANHDKKPWDQTKYNGKLRKPRLVLESTRVDQAQPRPTRRF